jgi:hypothetical protein
MKIMEMSNGFARLDCDIDTLAVGSSDEGKFPVNLDIGV